MTWGLPCTETGEGRDVAEVLVMSTVAGSPVVSLQSRGHDCMFSISQGFFSGLKNSCGGTFLPFLQVVTIACAMYVWIYTLCSCLSSSLGAQFLLLNVGLVVELASPRECHWLGKVGGVLKVST